MDRRLFYLARLAHVLWLRATFVSLAAVGATLLAHQLGGLLPQSAVRTVAPDAAEELLKIMATSMLAVATFSLATLVAAASAVTASTTPRAAALVLENKG
ncbi:MAG: DUF2254 domain-containing protein, partial [Pseudomonadota bacterium]|nr:DUF2254 domain-containing protein [Pseudomonadota bacterium]